MKLILGWNKAMKLTKILTIRANLRCLSGLHIGGGDTEMHIGGIDKAVVRNPLTGRPYIPGSSLKGKIRSHARMAHGHRAAQTAQLPRLPAFEQ